MKILVMGGSLFNGLALVRELVKHGHDVTVFNRGESSVVFPVGVKRLYGDRHDHAALRDTIGNRNFDCVQDISAYTPADVRSIVEIVRGNVGHYIFASSTVIYARSNILPITESHAVDRTERQSEYGINKILCEEYLVDQHRANGFPATMVPFSMVLGPNNQIIDREQRMFARLKAGRPALIGGDGTTLSQIGHVDDQARALRMIMLKPSTFGKRYNLTGKDYWSDEGYVDTFAEVIGVKANKIFVPHDVMDKVWRENRSSIRCMIQRLAEYIHPWNENTIFSVDRLRNDVGWEPEYTFPAAVGQTYEWFLAEGLDNKREFDFSFEDSLINRLSQ
jgi:nucleoside-diphosphate-sugar epimerase